MKKRFIGRFVLGGAALLGLSACVNTGPYYPGPVHSRVRHHNSATRVSVYETAPHADSGAVHSRTTHNIVV